MSYIYKDKIFFLRAVDCFEGYPFKIFRVLNREYNQPLHYHDYMQIWYVKHGECIHYLDDQEYKLTKGNIFILPPNIKHRVVSTDIKNTELIGCEFLESFISDNSESSNFDYNYLRPFLLSQDEIKPVFSLSGSAIKQIEELFENTLFEYNNKEMFFELHIKANLLKILSLIAREYTKDIDVERANILKKYKNTMSEAINYMSNNYNKKIYLDEVCRIAMMSPTYFSYVFKQITGRTFTEYLNFLRIMKAKELLQNYNKTVGGIAYEVGFSDPAYFDRVFKKEIGMSPGKFRKIL